MAGIGFELKKLLNKNNILSTIGGYFYATFISVGPIVVSVFLMLAIRVIMRHYGADVIDQNVILCSIMYSFMMGLIASSSISMVMSRFISDNIYMQTEEKILPALIGSLSLVIVISGTMSAGFYIFHGKLDVITEMLNHFLTIILALMYTIMIFISAIKDYKRITYSFIIGCVIGIVSVVLLIKVLNVNIVYSVIGGMVFGFAIITVLLLYNICIFFRINDKSYFEFLGYFRKYPRLIFINLLYIVTLFSHNAFVWHTDLGMVVKDTFICCPIYDVPAFIALMSIMPTTVIFVTRTETTFFDFYKEYIHTLSGGGTLQDLKFAGRNMRENMYEVLVSLFQEQLIITCLCIIGARYIFPMVGLADLSFVFFSYLAVGYFCIIAVNVISTIILYFDDRKTSMRVILVFFITQIAGVYLSIQWGTRAYGLGTAVSGILSFAAAFIYLDIMIKDLDYRLYCSQPIHNDEDAA